MTAMLINGSRCHGRVLMSPGIDNGLGDNNGSSAEVVLSRRSLGEGKGRGSGRRRARAPARAKNVGRKSSSMVVVH